MIPDYQTLMKPVLVSASQGERSIRDVILDIGQILNLTENELNETLSSGKETVLANRVHWAKTYLKQAGLVEYTKRGHFALTERGRQALHSDRKIDNSFLKEFSEFRDFQSRSKDSTALEEQDFPQEIEATPDEIIRLEFKKLQNTLAAELLDKVRRATPRFFEALIVDLLIAMGYGGSIEDAGRSLGQSGDNGVDGVIDQDALGVDQIYLQAKRYADGNTVGSGAIRDFFGALNIKRAQKGIFFTTSAFTPSAIQTAESLGSRIVLIDGNHLAKLMIRYGIGCRTEETFHVKKLDEDFFELS
ncbi:restriction endonuclease [Hyphococcus sp.]|uniref:restriction endonuclease n=1 Tax=Hyphococcus sp. TaxID=2038636 RepID=UPI00208C8D0C|nr:MAG: restriction endonuclease [Marinicaulis sp.]